jgi:cystathionine beta-lyase family protein involved in aluminum resistance
MTNEELITKCEKELEPIFKEIDKNTLLNSQKVIYAFHEYNFSESDLNQTVGYGYNDQGRDKLDQIFAYIFDAESAIVRNQFISGSHAITIAQQAILRPNDTLVAISGTPYDTLHEVIGIKPNNSSLKSFNIN